MKTKILMICAITMSGFLAQAATCVATCIVGLHANEASGVKTVVSGTAGDKTTALKMISDKCEALHKAYAGDRNNFSSLLVTSYEGTKGDFKVSFDVKAACAD